ncbi:uncharacterized protein LOC134189026 [Corticium candelabrum]|uniref:uncharacterized protein LOC134189026 n=1 Tax=Corticium candelabrum TaxID=121492 RepID=UPI002E26829E|nr:uncharacterized protein LOC134189026 [Corticium candelabrum]
MATEDESGYVMATRNSGENFELKYDDEELYEDLLPLKKDTSSSEDEYESNESDISEHIYDEVDPFQPNVVIPKRREPNFPRNFVVSQHFGQELMETVRDKRTTVKQDPKLDRDYIYSPPPELHAKETSRRRGSSGAKPINNTESKADAVRRTSFESSFSENRPRSTYVRRRRKKSDSVELSGYVECSELFAEGRPPSASVSKSSLCLKDGADSGEHAIAKQKSLKKQVKAFFKKRSSQSQLTRNDSESGNSCQPCGITHEHEKQVPSCGIAKKASA